MASVRGSYRVRRWATTGLPGHHMGASQIADAVDEGGGCPAQEREPAAQGEEPDRMAGAEDIPIPYADIGSEQTRDEGQRQDDGGNDRQDIHPAVDLVGGAAVEGVAHGVDTAGDPVGVPGSPRRRSRSPRAQEIIDASRPTAGRKVVLNVPQFRSG